MADGGAAKFRPAAVVARLETSGANKLRKPCAAEEAVLSLAPLLGALDPRNMPGPFIADGAGAGGAELSDLGGSDVVSWANLCIIAVGYGRVGIPDGAVNAATPMVDCYSAKSGRFARNLELLGPIAHWLGRALLIRGLPPPTACPTPTSVPAAPGPNLTPVKPERREGLNCN